MKIWIKIAILLSAVVSILASLIAIAMRWVVIDAVQQQSLRTKMVIASTVADHIGNLVLFNDRYRTDEALHDTLRLASDIEYIYVTNLDGLVFSHTFLNGYPPDLLLWNPLPGPSPSVQLLDTEKGLINDISVSIFEGSEARIHLGIRDTALQQSLTSISNTIFILTGVVIFVGSLAAFLFSKFFTIPLERLVLFSQRLSLGEFGESVPVSSNDEIGKLVAAFNSLSHELARYKGQMEKSYQQMCTTEKLTAMSRLSAGLAHELRNPLTAIKVLFSMTSSRDELTAQDLEMVRAEISYMDGILKRFLSVSRSDELDRQPMEVNEVLEKVLAIFRVPMKTQKVRLHFYPGPVPRFIANAPLLEQAFLNLLINAVEAMPEGGDLSVRTECLEHQMVVTIKDTGGGIPETLVGQIFDPFVTSKPEGTGLGLFLVKTIISSHHGSINCQTSLEGTCFTVIIPMQHEEDKAELSSLSAQTKLIPSGCNHG